MSDSNGEGPRLLYLLVCSLPVAGEGKRSEDERRQHRTENDIEGVGGDVAIEANLESWIA